jgi:hypothetical protein
MSDSFWRAIQDKQYLDSTGETARRRHEDDLQRRQADDHQRRSMGADCPEPKQGGR